MPTPIYMYTHLVLILVHKSNTDTAFLYCDMKQKMDYAADGTSIELYFNNTLLQKVLFYSQYHKRLFVVGCNKEQRNCEIQEMKKY
jgi:hypothetical protein